MSGDETTTEDILNWCDKNIGLADAGVQMPLIGDVARTLVALLADRDRLERRAEEAEAALAKARGVVAAEDDVVAVVNCNAEWIGTVSERGRATAYNYRLHGDFRHQPVGWSEAAAAAPRTGHKRPGSKAVTIVVLRRGEGGE